ncbi:GIY-YIG nuclease family protein [Tenacibaculum sp. M341]|uniref:GIY-YIG nuclease family protein n=1 Tax=Tenacibaculum sp. M341 TaxID=2530339 RepID=UPI0010517B75|nr:GIY-YIG nuclease family protein [Tenacibaculum sp. M341]TCI90025.1 GIY-YIG nuclease family protein [Tenacibaculum sp. M341]
MSKYPENIYYIERDEIIKISNWDNAQVGNVVRGLCKECYIIISEDELKTVRFDYINGENDLTGRGIQIDFGKSYFYDELLLFSFYLSKEFQKNDPIGIYNTYSQYFRTILEQNGYFTITSHEASKYQKGFLIGKQKIEVIKSIEKRDFLKNFLKVNKIEIKEGKTYLYLMLNEDTNLFKIGYSKNPIFREKTLQSEEPNIFTIKIWECDKNIETKLHKLFNNKRVRGEWFNLNIEDLTILNEEMNPYI